MYCICVPTRIYVPTRILNNANNVPHRYIGGEKEYEVELQFSSALVNHPDRINLGGEEYKDSENPVLGSVIGSQSELAGAGR